MNALREQLRGRDPYYLQALLKNGDSDDPLVRAAYAELSTRGQVPEYAEGLFDSPAGDMPDNLAASATPIAVDPDVKITSFGRRVVGPRTATGNAPVPGEYFQSEDEAEAYYNRGIDPKTGDVIASGADEGMLERGFRPVSKADGTVGYAVASGTEGMSTGNAGSAMMNQREQERLRRTGYWEPDQVDGPLGASTEVLVPTKANRQYNADLQERQSVDRFVGRTGMDRELAADMTRDQRRDNLSGKREQDLYARKQRMKEENIYARGSHNINSGNEKAIRQLARLQREDPKAHDQLLADNMGPRNVVQRYNPRTGQWEFSSERAYPPVANQDARMFDAMLRQRAIEQMQGQQAEQQSGAVRAKVRGLQNTGWLRGHSRQEAKEKIEREGVVVNGQPFFPPPSMVDSVLDEVFGPPQEVPPPDTSVDAGNLPVTTW
jgi:hypothetical protein